MYDKKDITTHKIPHKNIQIICIPEINNCTKNTEEIKISIPKSGCDISSIPTAVYKKIHIFIPGKLGASSFFDKNSLNFLFYNILFLLKLLISVVIWS
jgi:hypothetical protein